MTEEHVNAYAFNDGPEGNYNWDDLHPQLLELDDNKFGFEIRRAKDDDLSFSHEAIEHLAKGTMSFVLARCHAYWKETGKPPRKLRLLMVADLDHEVD